MVPLFSKVDLNKLWHDLQNEETLIYAKFGKDLFNISNIIGRIKVAQFFSWLTVYIRVNKFVIPRTRTKYGDRSFVWNSLPVELRAPDISLAVSETN